MTEDGSSEGGRTRRAAYNLFTVALAEGLLVDGAAGVRLAPATSARAAESDPEGFRE